MSCDEFKELAPAYALVALDEQERAACAHHLATGAPHRGCREAVAEAERVAARLGAALMPERPSPQVWRNIALRLDEVRTSSMLPEEVVRRRASSGTAEFPRSSCRRAAMERQTCGEGR